MSYIFPSLIFLVDVKSTNVPQETGTEPEGLLQPKSQEAPEPLILDEEPLQNKTSASSRYASDTLRRGRLLRGLNISWLFTKFNQLKYDLVEECPRIQTCLQTINKGSTRHIRITLPYPVWYASNCLRVGLSKCETYLKDIGDHYLLIQMHR